MENVSEHGIQVSVCVVTYNQVDLIEQCLRSILDQETSFDFEVIVGDDGSKDGTRDLISMLTQEYPGKLIPVFHPKNIGATQNYLKVHGLARGKYIAHCDGDDYWLPGKLSHQFHLLESDKDIAFVAETEKNLPEQRFFDINDLLILTNPVVHSSKMYRRENTLTRTSDVDIIDFYLNVEHARNGKVLLEKAKFTVYRRDIGIMRKMGAKLYRLNCHAAYHAYKLGARREFAFQAARNSRISLIKQSIHDGNWSQLDSLLQPHDLEVELKTFEKPHMLEKIAKIRMVRPVLQYVMQRKRKYLSGKPS